MMTTTLRSVPWSAAAGLVCLTIVLARARSHAVAEVADMAAAVDVADRLELFVTRHVIDKLDGVELRLHEPQPQPLPASRDPLRQEMASCL
jgi:hypothetical protein